MTDMEPIGQAQFDAISLFTPSDITLQYRTGLQNMKVKKILITGSTDGIGKQTALELALLGHTIIIHGRRSDRVEKTMDEIKRKSPESNVTGYVCDFSYLDNIRHFSELFHREHNSLDVLINNAGIFSPEFVKTADGFESTFAINHLSPFLLTNLLLDLLFAASPARVVNVSSMAHQGVDLDFQNLQSEKFFDGFSAYAVSKAANILFTIELAARYSPQIITVNALHPGVINTKLFREGWGGFGGGSVSAGASSSIYLATESTLDGITGKYFVNKEITEPSTTASNRETARKLWEISAELTGLEK